MDPTPETRAVGLHVGERMLSAVEIRREGDAPVLSRLGRAPLEEELTPESLLTDETRERISGTVDGLFGAADLGRKGVAISLGGGFSVIKRVPLEVASGQERREQIEWEAGHHLIDPVDAHEIEYHAFGRSAFLVAVRKRVAEALRLLCDRANLEIGSLEVDPLSLFHACRTSGEEIPDGEGPPGLTAVYLGIRWASCVSISGEDLVTVELIRLDRGGRRLRAGSEEETRAEAREVEIRALGRRIAGGLTPERRHGGAGAPRRVLLSGDREQAGDADRWWSGMDPLAVSFLDPFRGMDRRDLPETQRPLLEWPSSFAMSAGAAYRRLCG